MKKRPFFIIALALAILGLSLHCWAMGFVSRSVYLRALTASKPEAEKIQMRAEADSQLRRFPFLEYPSMALVVSSIGFLALSARRQEPAWRSVAFAVLFFYVISHFLLI